MRKSILLAAICVLVSLPVMLAPSCTITIVTPESVTSTETETVALPAGASVVVSNQLGTTTVNVDDEALAATIRIVRIAYAGSEEKAQALLDEMVVDITEPTAQDNRLVVTAAAVDSGSSDDGDFNMIVNGDDIVISSIFANARVANYRITVTLPPAHGVQVTHQDGVIRATGLDTASTLTGVATSIRLSDCATAVTVQTEAGDVETASHAGSLDATIQAGSAVLDFADLDAGDVVDVDVGTGTISIDLPPDVHADLQAGASLGVVSFDETDFTTVSLITDTMSFVNATLNGGGATIDLHTDVGSVFVGARN
jgi:hypothetical protein